jgi:GTP cyclohydrolase I
VAKIMKNQNDMIKMANAMQKDRDVHAQIDHESIIADPVRFEQSFNEIFDGYKVRPKRTDQDLIDAGHKHGDF